MTRLLPTSRRPDFSALLPADPARFAGPSFTWWFAAVCLTMIAVRSLIHLLSADDGAHSIATIDTAIAGGANIIALLGQWRAIQLLLAVLLWVLLIRYRGFVPLVLLVFLVEPVLRAVSGQLKPLATVGIAPGAAMNWVVVPVIAVTLWMALGPTEGDPS